MKPNPLEDAAEVERIGVIALHRSGLGEAAIMRNTGLTAEHVRAILTAAGIARPAHLTRASARGENLSDPNRADKLLRRF